MCIMYNLIQIKKFWLYKRSHHNLDLFVWFYVLRCQQELLLLSVLQRLGAEWVTSMSISGWRDFGNFFIRSRNILFNGCKNLTTMWAKP